jgi:hypothetical protein
MSLHAALLLGAAQLAPGADLAGLYQTQQIEVAAALELQQGGHFRYALEYGAVSEATEGDWTFDGSTLRLTSNPMPPELHALELGNARFNDEPLVLEDGDLLLERYETVFRFRRVEP